MDSLTQIVLGAACGEAALGKKIGNKALLFGAIGGTIPDLDVYVGNWIYKNEIDAMLFHRGFMHSILFALLASLIFSWISYNLYDSGKRLGITNKKDWFGLWFLALFTHPLLDCFTPYGTQLFVPFSYYRVAFNNIAVVDPLYTLPFLLCIIILMFFKRNSKRRNFWLHLGIGMSSAYMLLTIANKFYIDSVFRKSLAVNKIAYTRYITQPSIFNNILWYGVAETSESYFVADYSLFDQVHQFKTFNEIPKKRDLKAEDHPDIQSLQWFSNGYYNINKLKNGDYLYSDLRYPVLENGTVENESVFSFTLFKDGNRLNIRPSKNKFEGVEDFIEKLWQRIKGI